MRYVAALLFASLGAFCGPGVASTQDGLLAHQNALDRLVLARTIEQLTQVEALPVFKQVSGDHASTKFYTGPCTAQWLLVANTDDAQVRAFQFIFSRPVTLNEVSPFTGLIRRRGRAAEFAFRFRPGASKLFSVQAGPEDKHVKPIVMLNPSVQYGNVITDKNGVQVYNEGENMWDVAARVKDLLDADGRVEPHLSRSGRRAESSIQVECSLAKMLGCDAFVALHSDATGDGTEGGGTWTFYADESGKRLAETIHSKVLAAIREVYPEVQDRGAREHWNRLYVLHNSGCPASLSEILFHSNPKEREMLKSPDFQDRIAKAVAKGILEFFGYTN